MKCDWRRVPVAFDGCLVYIDRITGDVAQEMLQEGRLRDVPEEFAEFVRRQYGEETTR